MKTLNEHIKKREFQRVYLLYGEERYLCQQYRQRLQAAICPEDDGMNVSRFYGKHIAVSEVAALAETLPFFADQRVIVVEDSGWFRSCPEGFEEKLKDFPDTTIMIFVEQEVDKRCKLYKTVREIGYAAEMKLPREKDLLAWITLQCRKENKNITEEAANALLLQAGSSMALLQNELEKAVSYTIGRDCITAEDVREIGSTQTESRIFELMDAIGNQDRNRALQLYQDLCKAREPAMRILFLLTRQINLLLQVSEMLRLGLDSAAIASKAGIPPFTVRNYKAQAAHFSYPQLLKMLRSCQETETGIKCGQYQDQIGVELLMVGFLSEKV